MRLVPPSIDEVERLVGDARVDVHAAVVGGADEAVRVVVRVAEEARVLHRAQAARRHDVFAEQVVGFERAAARRLEEELGAGAHHVGERFVQRARLVQVNQVGRELGHAVRQLVRDDVERAREVVPRLAAERESRRQPDAVDHHAVAGVEGVDEEVRERIEVARQVRRRAPHRIGQAADPDVVVVETAPAEALEVVVVGVAGIDVRIVHRARRSTCCRSSTRGRRRPGSRCRSGNRRS